MTASSRFESRLSRIALHWGALLGISGAVAVVAVVWIEREPFEPVIWAVVLGILAALYGAILSVFAWVGLEWVEVGESELRVRKRGTDFVVPWADLRSYRHFVGKNESWRFDLASGARVGFRVEGFEWGGSTRMAHAIYERLVAAGRAKPGRKQGTYLPVR